MALTGKVTGSEQYTGALANIIDGATVTNCVVSADVIAALREATDSGVYFDAFALIMMYASLIEVIGAYKKINAKAHTVALLFVPAMMFVAISIVKRIYGDYAYSMERFGYGILISFIIIAVIALMTFLTIDIILAGRLRKKNQEIDENFDAFAKTKISMQIFAYQILKHKQKQDILI